MSRKQKKDFQKTDGKYANKSQTHNTNSASGAATSRFVNTIYIYFVNIFEATWIWQPTAGSEQQSIKTLWN